MRIVFLMTSCKKSGPAQQMLNIIKHLDKTEFEPYLVTLYPEVEGESLLDLYKPFVQHFFVPTSKLDMVLGSTKRLKQTLQTISPDVIHSLGVFPDFAVSRMKCWKQVITSRNFVFDDYPAKFGRLTGGVVAKMHLYAMERTSKTVTCSESLARIYDERLGKKFDFIRNGVDIEEYSMPTKELKAEMRKKLKLSDSAFVFVYTGQFIERKNIGFLLKVFSETIKEKDVMLLMLGGGVLLDGYKNQFGNVSNIDFRGNVTNVNDYLKACDVYVSTSKSEGLPNGVLEAMATGLPVVLSDIPQHLEIYNVNPQIGYVYKQDDEEMMAQKMRAIMSSSDKMGQEAFNTAHSHFSAKRMSKEYQELYKNVATK